MSLLTAIRDWFSPTLVSEPEPRPHPEPELMLVPEPKPVPESPEDMAEHLGSTEPPEGANEETLREVEIWDTIHAGVCPKCEAKDSFLSGPRGGMAINIKCSECDTRFWLTPVRGFGAKFLDGPDPFAR